MRSLFLFALILVLPLFLLIPITFSIYSIDTSTPSLYGGFTQGMFDENYLKMWQIGADGNITAAIDRNTFGNPDFNAAYKSTSTTYYLVSTETKGGTVLTPDINAMKYYDNNSYNIQEGSGANPLTVDINFTNVTTFSQIVVREYYIGSSSHHVQIQLWDTAINDWESYYDFVGQDGFTILTIPVYDLTDHIINGKVQLRFYHVQNGISSHELRLDFVWLINGGNIGASTNLAGYAKYVFGDNNFSGSGDFNTTTDINARNFSAYALKTCTVKTTVDGIFYCGADATGSGSFSQGQFDENWMILWIESFDRNVALAIDRNTFGNADFNVAYGHDGNGLPIPQIDLRYWRQIDLNNFIDQNLQKLSAPTFEDLTVTDDLIVEDITTTNLDVLNDIWLYGAINALGAIDADSIDINGSFLVDQYALFNVYADANYTKGIKAIKFFGKIDASNLLGTIGASHYTDTNTSDINGQDVNVNNFLATHVVDIDWDWDDAYQKGQTITTASGGTFTVTDQAPTETGLVITNSGSNTVQLSVDATDAWIGISGAADLVLNLAEGDALRAGDTAFADLGAPDFKWRDLWLSGGLSVTDANILDLNVGGDINANSIRLRALQTCTVKTDADGAVYCGTDINGADGNGLTATQINSLFVQSWDKNANEDANRNKIMANVIIVDSNLLIGTMNAPHGNVGAARFVIEGPNVSQYGPHVQYTTATDNYPVFQQLNWSHDNISLNFDMYYNPITAAWTSSDAGSSFQIYKISDALLINYEAGVAAGTGTSMGTAFKLTGDGLVDLNFNLTAGMTGTTAGAIIAYADYLEIVDNAPWVSFRETDQANSRWYIVVDGNTWSVRPSNTGNQALTIASNKVATFGSNVISGGNVYTAGTSTRGLVEGTGIHLQYDATDFLDVRNAANYWYINGVYEYEILPANFGPYATLVNTSGTASKYWSSTFSQDWNANSTASISGRDAGHLKLTSSTLKIDANKTTVGNLLPDGHSTRINGDNYAYWYEVHSDNYITHSDFYSGDPAKAIQEFSAIGVTDENKVDYSTLPEYAKYFVKNKLVESGSRIDFDNLELNENRYIKKEFFPDFTGDFTHEFDFAITSNKNASEIILWTITNAADGKSAFQPDSVTLYAIIEDGGLFLKIEGAGGNVVSEKLNVGQAYHIRIDRAKETYAATITTEEKADALESPINVEVGRLELIEPSAIGFGFLYAATTVDRDVPYGLGDTTVGLQSGYIENFLIDGKIENFAEWHETDEMADEASGMVIDRLLTMAIVAITYQQEQIADLNAQIQDIKARLGMSETA